MLAESVRDATDVPDPATMTLEELTHMTAEELQNVTFKNLHKYQKYLEIEPASISELWKHIWRPNSPKPKPRRLPADRVHPDEKRFNIWVNERGDASPEHMQRQAACARALEQCFTEMRALIPDENLRVHEAINRLATDARMNGVWQELTKQSSETGDFLHRLWHRGVSMTNRQLADLNLEWAFEAEERQEHREAERLREFAASVRSLPDEDDTIYALERIVWRILGVVNDECAVMTFAEILRLNPKFSRNTKSPFIAKYRPKNPQASFLRIDMEEYFKWLTGGSALSGTAATIARVAYGLPDKAA